VQFRYSEPFTTGITYGSEGSQSSVSVQPRLTRFDLPPPDGPRPLDVDLDSVLKMGGWRLRPWRQAGSGVAWLVGDLSWPFVIALPSPGLVPTPVALL
jgi:hypothetical protein